MAELSPESPLSLDEAAKVYLRGLVTASTLRAAAARGDLQVERIGKRLITTPEYIKAWRKLCLDRERERVSISAPRGATAAELSSKAPAGSSETDTARLAQVAALEKARKLKESSKRTSPANTKRPAENVHYLKSKSPT